MKEMKEHATTRDFELMSNFTLCWVIDFLSAPIILYWLCLLLIGLCAFPALQWRAIVHSVFPRFRPSDLRKGLRNSEEENSEIHAVTFLSQNDSLSEYRQFCGKSFAFDETKWALG